MPSTYTTQDGDMYDLISFRVYGSEFHVDLIIDANPMFFDTIRFTDGSVLTIPDLPLNLIPGTPPWIAIGSPS